MLIGCYLVLAIRCCDRFTGFRAPGGGAVSALKLTARVKEVFATLAADRTAVLAARQLQIRDFRKTESKEESKKSKQAIRDRAANRLV